MSNTSPALKRRRETAETCFYCPTTLTHNIPPRLPTDATIEHLHSRLKFPMGRPKVPNSIVIACLRCNMAQARKEEIELGTEVLTARAKAGHKS